MNQIKIVFFAASTMLMFSACGGKMIAPHEAVKCKLNYDSCMIANTFEGPLRSHEICLAERLPICHQLP